MKTIATKTNPVFKRVLPLPLVTNVLSPQASGEARGLSEFTPPPGDLRRKMTDLTAWAMNVSRSFNAPPPG